MWLYIGIALMTFACYKAKRIYVARHQIYRILATRNGPKVYLQWIRQLFTNQIGKKFVEMHHHYYIIHYPYGITWYKIIVPRRMGPCLIDTVTDHNTNNVKKEVFLFMGPSHNFHGLQVSPEMIGYASLTFTFLDGSEKRFEDNEIITL